MLSHCHDVESSWLTYAQKVLQKKGTITLQSKIKIPTVHANMSISFLTPDLATGGFLSRITKSFAKKLGVFGAKVTEDFVSEMRSDLCLLSLASSSLPQVNSMSRSEVNCSTEVAAP